MLSSMIPKCFLKKKLTYFYTVTVRIYSLFIVCHSDLQKNIKKYSDMCYDHGLALQSGLGE